VTAPRSTRPIIVFGDDWGRNVSTMQHLFRHLARRHPIIWVNAIGHRPPSLSVADAKRIVNKLRSVAAGARRGPATVNALDGIGEPPLEIVHPRVLPWHQYGWNRSVNRRSLVGAIRGALARHGLTERPILVTGTPPSVCVLGELDELASVYLCMDDFLHLPDVSHAMLAPLERALLERVDATVSTAKALVESKRPRSAASHYLPQGVNYDHFATPRRVPEELASLPRPLIGFAGGLGPAVDFPLVARLAAEHPKASVVLVGPASRDLGALAAPNIHILGPRPYVDLPAYVQAFDVGLIPYVVNAHTIAVDSLKQLEYLAAGVPVVTTALPEARKYAPMVRIAEDHDAFARAVRETLAEDYATPAARQALAAQHRWEARAADLERILLELAAR
jgi:glycosyltransferase involved in cell wall biosynthesis